MCYPHKISFLQKNFLLRVEYYIQTSDRLSPIQRQIIDSSRRLKIVATFHYMKIDF